MNPTITTHEPPSKLNGQQRAKDLTKALLQLLVDSRNRSSA